MIKMLNQYPWIIFEFEMWDKVNRLDNEYSVRNENVFD